MGLDMHIYEQDKKILELRDRAKTLRESLNNSLSIHEKEIKDELLEDLKDFMLKYKEDIKASTEESKIDYIVRHVMSYAMGNRTSTYLEWELFQCFTRFPHDSTEEYSKEVTKDLIKVASKYMLPDFFKNKLKKYEKLSDEISNCSEEVCYWRKYRDLNSYILNTFGGGNCEETLLDLNKVKQIRDFIDRNGENTSQVDELIEYWDEDRRYVYYPWW